MVVSIGNVSWNPTLLVAPESEIDDSKKESASVVPLELFLNAPIPMYLKYNINLFLPILVVISQDLYVLVES